MEKTPVNYSIWKSGIIQKFTIPYLMKATIDFFNLHQKVLDGKITQKEAAQILHCRESALKMLWKSMNLKQKNLGRPIKPINDDISQKVIDYCNDFFVGYQRCAEVMNEKGLSITEHQVHRIYEGNDLYTRIKQYQNEKEARTSYVAQSVNQIWHTDLHVIEDENQKTVYLIAFMDDRSRKILYYSILDHKTMISTAHSLEECIKLNEVCPFMLVIDNGKEFVGETFQLILKKYQIVDWRTRPYNPQQNGKIERFWQTLEQSANNKNPFINQIDSLINEYNFQWKHKSLTELYGRKITPNEAYNIGPHFQKNEKPEIIFRT